MTTTYTKREVLSNDSDINIVFVNGAKLNWVQLTYVSTATAGNRQVELRVKDAAGNVLYSVSAGAVQAASLTRQYLFMKGVAREAAFVATHITCPMPEPIVPPGGTLQIIDTAAIDAAADDLTVVYNVDA